MKPHLYQELFTLEETHFWHKTKRALILKLLKTYSPVSSPQILDMGCGTGKNLEVFNQLGTATGIDVSKEAIKFCQQRGLKRVSRQSLLKTNFKSSSFDVITLFDVVEHVDDQKAIAEIKRLLKPGGITIITVPAFSWLWSRWDEELYHHRRYTKSTLLSLLKDLHILKVSYFNTFLILPALIVRKYKTRRFKNQPYPSDFKLNHPLINILFSLQSLIENFLLSFINLPFGLSLIVVARRQS